MSIIKYAVFWIFVYVLVAICPLSAKGANTNEMQKSCQKFVQEFYNWYGSQPEKTDSKAGDRGLDPKAPILVLN